MPSQENDIPCCLNGTYIYFVSIYLGLVFIYLFIYYLFIFGYCKKQRSAERAIIFYISYWYKGFVASLLSLALLYSCCNVENWTLSRVLDPGFTQVSHVSTECEYPLGAEAKDMIEDEWAVSQVIFFFFTR